MTLQYIQDKDLVKKAIETTTCPYCKAGPKEKCKAAIRVPVDKRKHPRRVNYDGTWYVHQKRYDLVAPPELRKVFRPRFGHWDVYKIARTLYNKDLRDEGIRTGEAPWEDQPESVKAEYVERAKKERKDA